MSWIKHQDTFLRCPCELERLGNFRVVPWNAKCLPALLCQQPCTPQGKAQAQGDVLLGSWSCCQLQLSHTALVSSGRGAPHCWQRGVAVLEKKKSWVVLHHSVPQNKHKTPTAKKGRDPWRCQVQEATVTSQSPVPQHGSSAPGECSEHPRPGVTTSRMIWFESLARNKCCALFTTWPSCYLSNGIAPGSSNSGDRTQHLSFPEIQLRAFLRL